MKNKKDKISFSGKLISVQPRIRLLRSFDQSSHSYLGYALRVDGEIGDDNREFTVGIGKATQRKNGFRTGFTIAGKCLPVINSKLETVEFYKVSGLKLIENNLGRNNPPPWCKEPPSLKVYRERGHRRLAKRTYKSKCINCIWGCLMAVEIIIDQWNPSNKKYRTETFCYGPKSCKFYKAGKNRRVQGRKKHMVYIEEDWVDEQNTAHRGPDE